MSESVSGLCLSPFSDLFALQKGSPNALSHRERGILVIACGGGACIKEGMVRCILIFASLVMMTVTGCGIKPGTLEPPPGAEEQTFPRTYPDPSTDPS